jgi:hypothetical protein
MRSRDSGGESSACARAAIEARAVGITPDYAAAIRSASPSLADVTADGLSSMRAVGVTPGYVRALARSGFRNLDADTIVEARSVGLSPDYICSLSDAGLDDLSIDDLSGLAALGVTADDVRALRASGHKVTVRNLESNGALLDRRGLCSRRRRGRLSPRHHPRSRLLIPGSIVGAIVTKLLG